MANERLRAAMAENGLTHLALAAELGVNVKTVERWVLKDLVPFPRNRYALASRLGKDESYFWPNALTRDRAAAVSESEIVKVYPRRTDISGEEWRHLLDAGTEEIGILTYDGLFLAEDAAAQRILRLKAKSGIRIRILLGDPDDVSVAIRAREEGIGDALAAKIRTAIALYGDLTTTDGVEFRQHQTVLYNSIYRADDRLLVNTHIHGLPAAHAPVLYLQKISGGELANHYIESFERIWHDATPLMHG
ncbi:DUF5919 domain-containing protein [Kribbella yunnanensis]|uniref:DUF5919 domain-containing protein n=1 Tax=Kribbella yunnanensis TaxID=190194 RepID=A0ABP4UZV6_9ACTN